MNLDVKGTGHRLISTIPAFTFRYWKKPLNSLRLATV